MGYFSRDRHAPKKGRVLRSMTTHPGKNEELPAPAASPPPLPGFKSQFTSHSSEIKLVYKSAPEFAQMIMDISETGKVSSFGLNMFIDPAKA